jgi:hypothetical protein
VWGQFLGNGERLLPTIAFHLLFVSVSVPAPVTVPASVTASASASVTVSASASVTVSAPASVTVSAPASVTVSARTAEPFYSPGRLQSGLVHTYPWSRRTIDGDAHHQSLRARPEVHCQTE